MSSPAIGSDGTLYVGVTTATSTPSRQVASPTEKHFECRCAEADATTSTHRDARPTARRTLALGHRGLAAPSGWTRP